MKPANKTLAAILALLAIMLFAGCSSDSDSDDGFAGTTWTCSYFGSTMTIKFGSDGTATIFETERDEDGTSYTYSVSGSTVSFYNDDEDNIQFTYLSGYLLRNETATFTTESSLSSFSASSLAGTKWTYGTGQDAMTIEFGSGNSVTLSDNDEDEDETEYTYSVSGSAVIIYVSDSDSSYEIMRLIYSSGSLITGAEGYIFTKS